MAFGIKVQKRKAVPTVGNERGVFIERSRSVSVSATGLAKLQTVADYQFGADAGAALFPPDDELTVRRTKSGRPEQVLIGGERIVSYGTDGRFTLGLAGGRRLANTLDRPQCRVAVGAESVPFVCDGKNAFAKFVRRVDPAVRAGDEVLVVFGGSVDDRGADTNAVVGDGEGDGTGADDGSAGADPDALLAVGRAELPAGAMLDFETGMAVKVRHGTGDEP